MSRTEGDPQTPPLIKFPDRAQQAKTSHPGQPSDTPLRRPMNYDDWPLKFSRWLARDPTDYKKS